MKFGILFRLASAWVGWHYSPHNKRVCINLIPCVTFWVALPGGRVPSGPDYSSVHDGLPERTMCDCNQGRLPCTCKSINE